MAVSASICFPTRRRRAYLAVALASVAPQAAARGCEILVVEDDPHDPETAALAARFGARYLAHGAPRGLNAARNTALDAAEGELVCFLDDDVQVWPGWLDAMLAGVHTAPGHEVFGGPARTRRRGRVCGAGQSGPAARARGCPPGGPSRCRSPRSTSDRTTPTPS